MAIDNKDKKVLKSSIEREQNEVACSAECEKIKGSKNLNVPPLRFPEFTEEWRSHFLTDFMSFKNGMNPDAKRFGRGTKFISVMDILNNQFICYDNIRASVEVMDGDIDTYGVNYGDILFQRSSETLEDVGQANVYLDSKPAIFGGFVIRGKSKGNYNPLFFRYLLASPTARKRIIVKGAGAQHFNIGQDGLSKVSLDIPCMQEQKKIGELLQCIDARIATQNKIIDKLQSLIGGLNDYLHTIVCGSPTSFDEIGVSYSGLSGKSGDDFGSGKPFITYLNVYGNSVVDEAQVDYVDIKDGEKQNTINYGDMLFTLSSETPDEVGVGAVFLGESDKFYLNSFCFGIHITATDSVYFPYLAYLVSSTAFRKFVFPLAQGSTRFNLQKNDFMKKKFVLPSYQHQKTIAQTLDAISAKIKIEQILLQNYNIQKEYLLRTMFI